MPLSARAAQELDKCINSKHAVGTAIRNVELTAESLESDLESLEEDVGELSGTVDEVVTGLNGLVFGESDDSTPVLADSANNLNIVKALAITIGQTTYYIPLGANADFT